MSCIGMTHRVMTYLAMTYIVLAYVVVMVVLRAWPTKSSVGPTKRGATLKPTENLDDYGQNYFFGGYLFPTGALERHPAWSAERKAGPRAACLKACVQPCV